MRYEIINDKNVVEPSVVRQLDEMLERQAPKLDRYVQEYRKPLVLEVHSKKPGPTTYLITLILDLRTKPVVIKNKSSDPIQAFMKGFDALRHNLVKQLRMERRMHQRRRKELLESRLQEVVEPLVAFKEEQDPDMFVNLIKKAMPHLIGYLRRRISQANVTHTLRKEAKKAEDLANELYLRMYDRFDPARITNKHQFYTWLYQQADQLLTEVIDVHDERGLQESVEVLQKQHNRTMEENYSVDADGDYMMQEDFDDPTYHNNDPLFTEGLYDFYDFILDDNTQEQLEAETEFDLMDDAQQAAIHRMLYNLSDFKRSIFDLYAYEHLSEEDIALVKDVEVEKVSQVLEEIKQFMHSTLLQVNE